MGRRIDVDDLIDTQEVARILGLANRNTVSEYQGRYEDMPRPVVNLGAGRSKLWLRPEIERWQAKQVAHGRTRHRPRPTS